MIEFTCVIGPKALMFSEKSNEFDFRQSKPTLLIAFLKAEKSTNELKSAVPNDSNILTILWFRIAFQTLKKSLIVKPVNYLS